MLDIEKCSLVVVDVQGRLAQLMYGREALFANIQILIKSAKILDIPIVWCQQCPDALGPTVPQIAVSSGTLENKQVGLERLKAEGAGISSTETVLFELLRTAERPQFKQIAKLVK